MTTHPKPFEEMNEGEAQAWKEQLANLGKRPAAFAWWRETQSLESHTGPVFGLAMSADGKHAVSASGDGTFSESQYNYEPVLERVIENSADGKRYILGVRNAELLRLRELTEEDKLVLFPRLRPARSR